MNQVLTGFDVVLALLRPAFFWAAIIVGILALLDWLVRTRRLSPFSPISRFVRDTVDPRFKPIERMVVRAGGNPTSAPWWALVFVVVGGLVVLSLLDFVRGQVAFATLATRGGAGGLAVVALRWTFQILRLALIVRVASTWFQVSPYSRWIRWAYTLSEPVLAPLRRVVPTLGMVDITPIVAFLVLNLLESLVFGALG
ncbi:MAG: YggT family protein [Gemmatimonadetes bacterium]|nr:YggT family protein [Gemmatimonadota bacterium]